MQVMWAHLSVVLRLKNLSDEATATMIESLV